MEAAKITSMRLCGRTLQPSPDPLQVQGNHWRWSKLLCVVSNNLIYFSHDRSAATDETVMAPSSLTPSERIHELGEINQTLSKALQDAGLAVQALSKTMPQTPDDQAVRSGDQIVVKKAQFEEHVRAYYTGVQAAVAKMRRQAYALEEAGVISAEAPAFGTSSQRRQPADGTPHDRASAQKAGTEEEVDRITNGGLGNLDVGWLNSRGNKVSAEKEAELIKEAKALLEDVTSQKAVPDEAT